MEALAYELADRITALYASEVVQQQSMGMEFNEWRDFLAGHIDDVLRRHPPQTHRKPTRLATDAEAGDQTHITDNAARKLLENAPGAVKVVYGKCRRNGIAAGEALGMALEEYRRKTELVQEFPDYDAGVPVNSPKIPVIQADANREELTQVA